MGSRRGTITVLLIVGAVLIAAYFLPFDKDRLTVVASLATAFATIAALLSALASNQAARESSMAAREATRALSYAARPKLDLLLQEYEGRRHLLIENVSTHRAETLILTLTHKGIEETRALEPLDGMKLSYSGLSFGQRGPIHNVELPGFIPGADHIDRVSVRYAGSTGPTQWVVSYQFGPGLAVESHFDHRYYRPAERLSDREADQV